MPALFPSRCGSAGEKQRITNESDARYIDTLDSHCTRRASGQLGWRQVGGWGKGEGGEREECGSESESDHILEPRAYARSTTKEWR